MAKIGLHRSGEAILPAIETAKKEAVGSPALVVVAKLVTRASHGLTTDGGACTQTVIMTCDPGLEKFLITEMQAGSGGGFELLILGLIRPVACGWGDGIAVSFELELEPVSKIARLAGDVVDGPPALLGIGKGPLSGDASAAEGSQMVG